MKFSLWANLYPSTKAPYYGTFVYSTYLGWQQVLGDGQVHKCVIDAPAKTLLKKLINYAKLYLCCIADAMLRRPTLVEIHYPYFFIPLLFMLRKNSAVLRFHGSDLEKLMRSKTMWALFRRITGKVCCIVVPSTYFQERIFHELQFPGKVLVVAPDAVSDIFYPADPLLDETKKVIGVAGRLTRKKNIQEAIEALSLIKDKSVRLLVVGDGPYKNSLVELAAELGVSEQIEWEGLVARENLVNYMHKMSVFVFSSIRSTESFGLVGVEALASGVPVIARASLRGAQEYLNTLNSITYDNSAASLAEALKEYFQLSDGHREEMKQQALLTASHFNFDDIVVSGVNRILHTYRN